MMQDSIKQLTNMENEVDEEGIEIKRIIRCTIGSMIRKFNLEKNIFGLLKINEFKDFLIKMPFEEFEEIFEINKKKEVKKIKDIETEQLCKEFFSELRNKKIGINEDFVMAHYRLVQKFLLNEKINRRKVLLRTYNDCNKNIKTKRRKLK